MILKNKKIMALMLMTVTVMGIGLASCSSDEGQAVETKQDTETSKEVSNDFSNLDAMDMNGNQVTKDIFAGYDLTMVNVFSITCGPCMGELPDLIELTNELQEQKINIVGLNVDLEASGEVSEDAVKTVNEMKGDRKFDTIVATSDLYRAIPNFGYAIPHTFFVDKDGKVVGKTYTGAKSKDEWAKVIEEELKNVK